MDKATWGIPTLVNKIVDMQMKVVSTFIPELLSTLRNRIRALENEKKKLPFIITSDEEKHSMFVKISQEITTSFNELMEGRILSDDSSMNICARFHEFSSNFQDTLQQGLPNFLNDKYRDFLHSYVKETRGVNLANFMSGPVFVRSINQAFDTPISDGVADLLDNSFDLVGGVWRRIIEKASEEYPLLGALLGDVVESEVEGGKREVNILIETLLDAEKVVALTLNPAYMKSIEAFKNNMMLLGDDGEDQNPTTEENRPYGILGNVLFSFLKDTKTKLQSKSNQTAADIFEMQVSLHCYARLKKERVVDHIVLLVRYFLFTHMAKRVSTAIWKIQNYKECLNPDPDALRQSLRIERTLERLKRVQTEVKKVM